MLDAFAVELHQILFDLAAALARLFVQRDADLAVGCGQRLRREAGVFTLDVEEPDFAEVEQALVKISPEGHATAVHVVCQVVDEFQAMAHRVAVHALDEVEVDVVDGFAVFKPVDQVQRCAANAFDGGQVQLHRAGV